MDGSLIAKKKKGVSRFFNFHSSKTKTNQTQIKVCIQFILDERVVRLKERIRNWYI